MKLEYNESDIGGNEYSGIDDSMKMITRSADPIESCIIDINNLAGWMHKNMYNASDSSYIVNSYGMFSGFGALYLSSNGSTNTELKSHFGFQEKSTFKSAIMTLNDNLNSCRSIVVMDNYLISDNRIACKGLNIKGLGLCISINHNDPIRESTKINSLINGISGVDQLMSDKTVSNIKISLINVCKIHPIWNVKPSSSITGKYKGKHVNYIRFVGKMFGYFEDGENQILEIPCQDNNISVGFVLQKTSDNVPIDVDKLMISISYLKATVLNEVLIPKIKKRFKTRYNSILKKSGLNMVFKNSELPGLYPEGGSIGDVIQYVDLLIDDRNCGRESKDNNNTVRKFVANRDFEMYIRHMPSDTLLMIGRI
jgi:serine protease inhibitor